MKSVLISIALFSASSHLLIAQNVRIIRASDRATVSSPVIIPTPPRTVKTNDTTSVTAQHSATDATKSVTSKKSSVKSVRGSSCKKPCVKKVCYDRNKSSYSTPTRKKVTTESAKK